MAAATHAQPSGVDGRDEPNVAAANRRNGAHAVLAAASALVGLPPEYAKARAVLLLLLLLLGCATVHLSMGGNRHRHWLRAVAPSPAARVVDRSRARLRWTGFHALLFLAGSRLLLGPRTAAPPSPSQLLGANALLVTGAILVLVSTAYDGVPRSVSPAAAAAARGLDGLLFGGRFAPASDADD